MCLCVQVIEALKHLGHQGYRQVVTEIFEAHMYRLLFCEVLLATKVSPHI